MIKKNAKFRAGGVVQVVECLPSKCEALSLNPSTEKKKKKKKKKKKLSLNKKSINSGHYNFYTFYYILIFLIRQQIYS
jgi:hypothetical protein